MQPGLPHWAKLTTARLAAQFQLADSHFGAPVPTEVSATLRKLVHFSGSVCEIPSLLDVERLNEVCRALFDLPVIVLPHGALNGVQLVVHPDTHASCIGVRSGQSAYSCAFNNGPVVYLHEFLPAFGTALISQAGKVAGHRLLIGDVYGVAECMQAYITASSPSLLSENIPPAEFVAELQKTLQTDNNILLDRICVMVSYLYGAFGMWLMGMPATIVPVGLALFSAKHDTSAVMLKWAHAITRDAFRYEGVLKRLADSNGGPLVWEGADIATERAEAVGRSLVAFLNVLCVGEPFLHTPEASSTTPIGHARH